MEDKELFWRIGANITKIRKAKGLTVQGLADDIEMDKSNLIAVEKGRKNATLGTLNRIAKALCVNVAEILKI